MGGGTYKGIAGYPIMHVSQINDSTFTDPDVDTTFVVDSGAAFAIGDVIQTQYEFDVPSGELMLITNIVANTLTVVRGYSSTDAEDLENNLYLNVMSHV